MRKLTLQRDLSEGRVTSLTNATCPYCGVELTRAITTRDHFIARNFVPLGSLDAAWNMVLNSCRTCNLEKSDLEDDISAITLRARNSSPTSAMRSPAVDQSARKSKGSISRRTRRPVGESDEPLSINTARAGASITFGLVAPPQLARERTGRLAQMQVLGLTYVLSYVPRTRRSAPPPPHFRVVDEAARSDWGNARQRAFMNHIRDWTIRCIVSTANGHFRVLLRRQQYEWCWSFAIEWNRQRRIIGFVGTQEMTNRAASALPRLEQIVVATEGSAITTLRKEQPLDAIHDEMFGEEDTEPPDIDDPDEFALEKAQRMQDLRESVEYFSQANKTARERYVVDA